MSSISRRQFVAMLAAAPFLDFAAAEATQRESLTRKQVQAMERILLNLVVTKAILSSDTLKAIYTVPTSPDSALTHYASGWFIEPSGVIWHGGALAGYGTVNMLFPTGHSITLLANTSPGERYKPGDTALDMYNDAAIGPQLPTLLPVVRSTKPE